MSDPVFRAQPDLRALLSKPIIRSGSRYGTRIPWLCVDHGPCFVRVHFAGRSTPCLGEHCPGCKSDKTQSTREMAYLGGGHVDRKIRGVLELTAQAGAILFEASREISLRGRVIVIDRRTARGQMLVEITDQLVDLNGKWDGWDTPAILAALWGLPLPPAGPGLYDPADPRVAGDFSADEWRHVS